jgi:hypothetical protein
MENGFKKMLIALTMQETMAKFNLTCEFERIKVVDWLNYRIYQYQILLKFKNRDIRELKRMVKQLDAFHMSKSRYNLEKEKQK